MNPTLNLDQIIEYSQKKNKLRELAWREFLKIYKGYIYKVILVKCKKWDVSRLNMQMNEVVNDIVSETLINLVKNLHKYRETHDEKKFRFWLSQICNHTASRYLRNHFTKLIINEEIGKLNDLVSSMENIERWETFENLIATIRSLHHGWTRNIERDIFIFNQYIFADFTKEMIQSQPCFEHLGDRVIDNVLNRIKIGLRKSMKKFESF